MIKKLKKIQWQLIQSYLKQLCFAKIDHLVSSWSPDTMKINWACIICTYFKKFHDNLHSFLKMDDESWRWHLWENLVQIQIAPQKVVDFKRWAIFSKEFELIHNIECLSFWLFQKIGLNLNTKYRRKIRYRFSFHHNDFLSLFFHIIPIISRTEIQFQS